LFSSFQIIELSNYLLLMPQFSIIIPVYNRPDEVDELLQSLTDQSFKSFDVVIVDDGSQQDCKAITDKYVLQLDISYYYKPNTGPGTTRNYGAQRAKGDYFIFFDSDCIIPSDYMAVVSATLGSTFVDAYGGPDMAHPSFTSLQKAINYAMTSFFTTGGIRGGKKKLDKFHPRSFNMGISKRAFEATGGYSSMRFGEDIDFSLRLVEAGYTTRLIGDAAVFHKRRTDFKKFYKQVFNSGVARINLFKLHPASLKIVHVFPSLFVGFTLLTIIASCFDIRLAIPFVGYFAVLAIHSLLINKELNVALLSVVAGFIQLFAYGTGFILAMWKRIVLKQSAFHSFQKNFYK